MSRWTREDGLEDIVARKKVMAGNWKMHKTVGESVALVEQLREALAEVTGREILVCPPFTALYAVAQTLQESNI